MASGVWEEGGNWWMTLKKYALLVTIPKAGTEKWAATTQQVTL